MLEYKVQGFKNCLLIKTHFLTYPLLTNKLVYFTPSPIILKERGRQHPLPRIPL